ncbi:MAG: hypothetical protein K2Q11_12350 [Burkholderiaceae bacterium]|nr:hypothetical protein [Burkholderiaceae bacterium]
MVSGQLRSAKTAPISKSDKLAVLEEWTEAPQRTTLDDSAIARQPIEIGAVPSTATKAMTFRLPLDLCQKLKFFGETTYGKNMTDIVIESLRDKLIKMEQERTIQLRRELENGVNFSER